MRSPPASPTRVSSYVTEKVDLLENQVGVAEAQLAAVEARITEAQEQQDALADEPVARRSIERLLLSQNLNCRHHDRRRAAFGSPGRPRRREAAAQPRRERRVEPDRRACSREQDDGALEPLVAPRRRADRAHRRRDRRSRRRSDRRSAAGNGNGLGLMLEGKRVAVVVPAFDEERLVGETIRGIPEFVDRIFVVDDASRDGDGRAAEELGDARVAGPPSRAERGRRSGDRDRLPARARGGDRRHVRHGGRQPDGSGRASELVAPVARGEVDYAKANRLVSGEAWKVIPRTRYLGNAVLSLLTKIASGYWHVADSQAGYTALSLDALRRLDLDRALPALRLPERHARPPERPERARARRPLAADLRRGRAVGHQAALGRAADLVAPVQGVLVADGAEVRDPRLPPARLLLRLRRADARASASCSGSSSSSLRIAGNAITPATIVLVAVLLIAGLQMTLFAMWFDMEANKDLR